ncbi:MAG: hypothetical protein DRJ36_04295 [Thermoprotei archaeon]|nr:MAG: hypothetical protein DRJ36_04295 [Thermoprotei archaeon]
MANVEELYERLLSQYRNLYLNGERRLEREIRSLMHEGLSKEEAIAKLYERVFGSSLRYPPETAPKARPEDRLELALEELRSSANMGLLGFLVFVLVIMPIFFFNPPLGFALAMISTIICMVTSLTSTSWKFQETLTIEGGAAYKDEILSRVSPILQEMLLENVSARREGNRLVLKIRAGKTVIERNGRSSYTKYADLGTFTITADFEKRNGNLVVDVCYEGSPPRRYGDVAAELFEKFVVGFRASLRRALKEVKPKAVIEFDFTSLIEKLLEKGIILKEIKCPRCGAPLKLPEKGSTVVCKYCSAVIKAIDVYSILKESFEALKSLEPDIKRKVVEE